MASGKFFSYDPEGDGFQLHDTAEEAKKVAEEGINNCNSSIGWLVPDYIIEQICWGEVKEIATQTNLQKVDARGFNERGEEVGTDYDFTCDYELKEVSNG